MEGVICAAMIALLYLTAIQDAAHRRISGKITAAAALLSAADLICGNGPGIGDRLAGACLGGGLLLACALIREGSFGGGDIRLMAAEGLFLGWRGTAAALMTAVSLAAVRALMLSGIHRRIRNIEFAFGPFLAAGCCLAILKRLCRL